MLKYQAIIDINDITRVIPLQMPSNVESHAVHSMQEKKHYIYDYFIQINLSRLNGYKIKRKEILNTRRHKPVATVFFRFSHKDKDNKTLKNSEQKAVVQQIQDKLARSVAIRKESFDL